MMSPASAAATTAAAALAMWGNPQRPSVIALAIPRAGSSGLEWLKQAENNAGQRVGRAQSLLERRELLL